MADVDKMKMGFDPSALHKGKILLTVEGLNFRLDSQLLWANPLGFQFTAGERIAIKGSDGSGKTTLIRLILGRQERPTGLIKRAEFNAVYIDQDYALIHEDWSVYEQAQSANSGDYKNMKLRFA